MLVASRCNHSNHIFAHAFAVQLAASGQVDHMFSLCFGFPSGGGMMLGECTALVGCCHGPTRLGALATAAAASIICWRTVALLGCVDAYVHTCLQLDHLKWLA